MILALKLGAKMLHQTVVDVFSSQVCVATSGFDFENSLIDRQQGNIVSATAKVENHNVFFLVFSLVNPVSDRGGCWLVDDAEHFEPRNGASVFGGLSLRVVEIPING